MSNGTFATRDGAYSTNPTPGPPGEDAPTVIERAADAPGAGAARPAAPPREDPTRIGRYTVLRRIGAGGMRIVYAAYDEDLDRKIAIKLLREDLGGDELEALSRMRREAQAMAKLSHPHVVHVYDLRA